MAAMKIVQLKIGDITPYLRDPRDNAGAVEAVAASIKQFRFYKPIVWLDY